MLRHPKLFLPLLAAACLVSQASAQVRIVQWNVTNYSSTSGGVYRDPYFQRCLFNSNPANGMHMIPDIFAVQEMVNATGADRLLGVLNAGLLTIGGGPTNDYARAPFVDGPDTDAMLYYRQSKFKLIRTVTVYATPGGTGDQPRDTMRYDLQPVGYTDDATIISIYSVHLKAQGSNPGDILDDATRRWIETKHIRNDAAALNLKYSYVVCGDFNIQTSSVSEYQEFIKTTSTAGSTRGRFVDPISTPGSWNNNPAFKIVHTQEPGTQMDDRFDQILLSPSFFDGKGLEYIGDVTKPYSTTTWNDPNHSYRCFGNDGTGNGTSTPLNTTSNSEVGNSLASDLIQTCKEPNSTSTSNGHLPVYLDFKVPAKASVDTTPINFGTIIKGRTTTATIQITNSGDTTLFGSSGVSALNYSATGTGINVPTGTFKVNPGATGTLTVTLNANTVGTQSGQITITTDAPDQPTFTISWQAVVTKGGGLH